MSPVSWAADEVTVTVPGEYTERGSVYHDWDNPARVMRLRGLYEPGPGSIEPDAYAVEVTGTFRANGIRDVPAPARVDVPGEGVFLLAGDGQRLRSPTGAVSHTLLVLTKWEVR